VFNMGCGFCCVVAAGDTEAAVELLRDHYPEAKRMGTVTDRVGSVVRG
jgi:phosphoribosylaminoimidazole (AIR) synthetase